MANPDLDELLMQTLGVTIERVRVRHEVAEKAGPTGPGCAASLGLWTDILAHLEAANRYYERNCTSGPGDAQRTEERE